MRDLRPLYSTVDIEAITNFIDKHYELEGPIRCQLLQRGLNDVYSVYCGNGDRYVFRLSQRRGRGPADVNAETAFLTHLSHSGVPVAAPIPARNGNFFIEGQASEGPRAGVLFQALLGRAAHTTDVADARANGKTLAMLHTAAETFSHTGALYRLDLQHLLWRPLAPDTSKRSCRGDWSLRRAGKNR